jgi:Flp pilus assembly pilin Flp
MLNLFQQLWEDESGAEVAEWVIVVALLVIVAIAIYTGVLQGSLSDAVSNIGSRIESSATG